MGKVRYLAAGDSSVSVEFGNEISPEINRQIRAFKIAVEKSGIPGIVETVPTYRSLLVNYKPEVIRFQDLTKEFEGLLGSLGSIVIPPPEVIEIPVLYGGEMGPDIENVAKHNNKTVEEVIKIHTSEEYLIYMLGFIAGFPYLGGMDERIVCPRLQTPRTKIPAGAVGIGGKQTGIYPLASPGGWQLIGRTPLRLFDPAGGGKLPYAAGDRIRFVPISPEKFETIQKEQGAAL